VVDTVVEEIRTDYEWAERNVCADESEEVVENAEQGAVAGTAVDLKVVGNVATWEGFGHWKIDQGWDVAQEVHAW
jgi:hypothetical protein